MPVSRIFMGGNHSSQHTSDGSQVIFSSQYAEMLLHAVLQYGVFSFAHNRGDLCDKMKFQVEINVIDLFDWFVPAYFIACNQQAVEHHRSSSPLSQLQLHQL